MARRGVHVPTVPELAHDGLAFERRNGEFEVPWRLGGHQLMGEALRANGRVAAAHEQPWTQPPGSGLPAPWTVER